MVATAALKLIFRKIVLGKVEVVWPDGQRDIYGDQQAPSIGRLILKTESAVGRVVREPELGFAEGYMAGEIEFEGDVHDLMLLAIENQKAFPTITQGRLVRGLLRGLNQATSVRAQKTDISHHYDLGNEFFRLFLDKSMTYSCAYFRREDDSLGQAQLQKVDHVLRKLRLQPGEHLLDIGSGWGELIIRAAKQYGVTAHGITLSEEQAKETEEWIAKEGLQGKVTVALTDYREHAKSGHQYDKIASVGMFEHVGRPNLGLFMQSLGNLTKPGGVVLLHTITKALEQPGGKFTTKYIFPGGYIPSVRETVWQMPESGFDLIDAENLRYHYALTLDAWTQNYEKHLDKVRELLEEKKLDSRFGASFDVEKFIRMWRLYLRGASAGFRGGTLGLHQFLMAKGTRNDLPLTREDWYGR